MNAHKPSLVVSDVFAVVTAVLVCFPFLRIIPILAEAQPIFLLSILGFVFSWRSVSKRFVLLILLVFAYFIYSLSLYGFAAAAGSLMAFIVPIFIFEFFRNVNTHLVSRVILNCFWVYMIVAMIQLYVSTPIATLLLKPLAIMIPRFEVSALSDYGRGISIVASEPSTMGPLILVAFAAASYLSLVEARFGRLSYLIVAFSCCLLVFQTMSILAYGIFLVFILSVGLYSLLTRGGTLRVISAGAIVLVLGPLLFEVLPERLTVLIELLIQGNDFYLILDRASGSRLTIFLAPYCNFLNDYSYSSGLGAWSEHFYSVSSCLPIDFATTEFYRLAMLDGETNVKPASIVSLALLDVGRIGVLFFVFFIWAGYTAWGISKAWNSPVPFALVATSSLFLTVGGFPITMPSFWIILALVLSLGEEVHFNAE